MKEYEKTAIRYSTEPAKHGFHCETLFSQAGFIAGVRWAINQLRSDGWLDIADKAGLCGDVHELADWLEREESK